MVISTSRNTTRLGTRPLGLIPQRCSGRHEQHRCQYSGRLVGRRIRRGSASYGTGGLDLFLDRMNKILEGHILNGDEDAHRVSPPAVLNGEDIVLIISRPSGRRADRTVSVRGPLGASVPPPRLPLSDPLDHRLFKPEVAETTPWVKSIRMLALRSLPSDGNADRGPALVNSFALQAGEAEEATGDIVRNLCKPPEPCVWLHARVAQGIITIYGPLFPTRVPEQRGDLEKGVVGNP